MLTGFIAILAATFLAPALAGTYKWVDEKGVTHYGDSVPPHEVNRAITEINRKGLMIRKSEAALSPEQLKIQREQLMRQQELAQQSETQKRRDRALLGAYTTEEEIDLARDRNTERVESSIRLLQERRSIDAARRKLLAEQLESYKDKSDKLRGEAKELIEEIEQSRLNDKILLAAADELRKHKDELAKRFQADKIRFRELKQGGLSAAVSEQARVPEAPSAPLAINDSNRRVVAECVSLWVDAGQQAKAHAAAAESMQSYDRVNLVIDGRVPSGNGYTARRMVCPLTTEGRIDQHGTEVKKVLAALGARY